jgi:hypothetical protein
VTWRTCDYNLDGLRQRRFENPGAPFFFNAKARRHKDTKAAGRDIGSRRFGGRHCLRLSAARACCSRTNARHGLAGITVVGAAF